MLFDEHICCSNGRNIVDFIIAAIELPIFFDFFVEFFFCGSDKFWVIKSNKFFITEDDSTIDFIIECIDYWFLVLGSWFLVLG